MISLIKVVAILVAIVWLSRRRVDFGVIMLGAAVACAVAFSVPAAKAVRVMLRGPFVPSNFAAIVVVGMVGVLKALMVDAGMIGRIVKSLRALIRDPRAVVAVLPAFIGLLPSAGGAVMSCSMVEEASEGMGLTREQKAAANYWYRHLIEHIVPVYPAYVMASQLSGTPVRHMMMLTLAGAVVHALSAVPIVFRGARLPAKPQGQAAQAEAGCSRRERRANLASLMLSMAPIMGTVILVVFFEWHIGIALGLAIAAVLVYRNPGWRRFWQIAKDSFVGRPALMLVGIMVFKEMLVESGAVDGITEFLASAGAPPLIVAVALPFSVAVATGMSTASVGISFPMLAGFFATVPNGQVLAAVAYTSAVAGLMSTPTHLCLVLTVDYFGADIGRVIRMIAPAIAAVAASGPVVYVLSQLI